MQGLYNVSQGKTTTFMYCKKFLHYVIYLKIIQAHRIYKDYTKTQVIKGIMQDW